MTPEGKLRIIVSGGRDFADPRLMNDILSQFNIAELAQGGASGADALAHRWAFERRIPCRTFDAKWNYHGKAAGRIRNSEMLSTFHPDLVILFPGGKGTAHMTRIAREGGYNLFIVEDLIEANEANPEGASS